MAHQPGGGVDSHRLEGRTSQEGLTSRQLTPSRTASLDGVGNTDTIKPFHLQELLEVLAKVLKPLPPGLVPRQGERGEVNPGGMVGSGPAMQKLYKDIGLAADTTMTVLIRGDTGTGKELVARAIHQNSDRANKPFVAVNCNAIPETLLEGEFFGHERGAFTGAYARKTGFFEQAHGGTLFLDEIGDLSLTAQVKLLRVLQERSIQRLGGKERITLDVRILAATHRDLETTIREKQFREDFFYRVSALTIQLPALCERAEDIPDLTRCFLKRSAEEMKVASVHIQHDALDFLKAQSWRGNVRELENVMQHAVLLARGQTVSVDHVREAYCGSRRPILDSALSFEKSITELLAKAEKDQVFNLRDHVIDLVDRVIFKRAIERAEGNQAKAARWLNVTRNTMREKLARFGL